MKKAIQRWQSSILTMEELWYDKDDEDELYMDIAAREDVNENTLTAEELLELEKLDHRFRLALYPALRKAKLVEYYKRHGLEHSLKEWWWHVKEKE